MSKTPVYVERRSLWRRIKPHFNVFDGPLAFILSLIFGVSAITMYSAGMDAEARFEGHVRNFAIAASVMWAAAMVPSHVILRLALPIYTSGVLLLLAVAMFGMVKKGARRWIDLGIVIQPSEIMKIAVPLMLAWYFQRCAGVVRSREFCIAGALVLVPFILIARQPDLGTALLVSAAGFYVIFLAGLSWKVIAATGTLGLAAMPIAWSLLHDYQRTRVMTLIDPTTDPLGKGFHIIQSTIAIGSGGVTGKGWLGGTQAHLEFVPERTTDFLFAVYSEEFGLLGNALLLFLYLLLIGRGFQIAVKAGTVFGRLLAGALSMMFFTYAFVNMGMVSGILPVVGVPLPFMSYGGTAFVTLGLGVGLLMNIQRHRTLVQT